MTDQRLRDLERDAAHGDLRAQARLLLERVRVGDLAEERLRLAAYCGHEAARAAVLSVFGPLPASVEDLLVAVAERDEALRPLVMICVARTMLQEVAGVSDQARTDCERVLSVTEARLQSASDRVWEAADIADEVYNDWGGTRTDVAALHIATAPAFLAAGRSNARFICSVVSGATSFLGVSLETIRVSVATWLLAPRGSST